LDYISKRYETHISKDVCICMLIVALFTTVKMWTVYQLLNKENVPYTCICAIKYESAFKKGGNPGVCNNMNECGRHIHRAVLRKRSTA
jgi:hypothetical protein